MSLEEIGWSPYWDSAFAPFAAQDLRPGRVFAAHRGRFDVWTAEGKVDATGSGRLRFSLEQGHDQAWPVTGDWVALDGPLIHAVVPRRTAFSRKQAGAVTAEQVLAANIDVALIVCGLDGDFSIRRLERYLYLARIGGARPVIVLNKADLCTDTTAAVRAAENVASGVGVVLLSAAEGTGVNLLTAEIEPGETAALLGSSGVGKSTIVNRLRGWESQRTQPVREHDSRGRHTTSHRELIPLDLGWLLMDVPGIRELQLWPGEEAQVNRAFPEISDASTRCRFSDCRHAGEPGCAVIASAEAGEIDRARLESYDKLRRELEYTERRQNELAAREYKQFLKQQQRGIRRMYRERERGSF